MSFRVLLSPVVEVLPRPARVGVTAQGRVVDETHPDAVSFVQPRAYLAKAEQYCQSGAHHIALRADRTPHPLALTFGAAPDWTAADADPEVDTLIDSPAASADAFRAVLAQRQLADFPAGARARLRGRLTALGIGHGDLDDTATLDRLIRRIRASILEHEHVVFGFPAA